MQDLLARRIDQDGIATLQAILFKLSELTIIAQRQYEREENIVFFTIDEDGTTRQFQIGTTEIDFIQGTLINPNGTKEYLYTSLALQHKNALHSLSVDTDTDCVLQINNYSKRLIQAGFSTQIPWLTYTTIKITCTALTNIQIFACTNPQAVIGQFKSSMITNFVKGTATITAETTSVNVTHGNLTTPTIITIAPQDENGLGWYVTAIGATTFTINLQVPPVSDTIFIWGCS